MTCTPTLPLDDQRMWRKAVAAVHPDRGGSHELCVWIQAVRDAVVSNKPAPTPRAESPRPPHHRPQGPHAGDEPARVPFPENASFDELTSLSLERAGVVEYLYGRILWMLNDCYPLEHLAHEQQRGASYKRLAYIAHLARMSKSDRISWYRIAEGIPLSDRHAGHLITHLKRSAA